MRVGPHSADIAGPSDAAIKLVEDKDCTTLRVWLHSSDVGRLTGENRRTVHALQVVVNATAAKHGYGRFNVEIGNACIRQARLVISVHAPRQHRERRQDLFLCGAIWIV